MSMLTSLGWWPVLIHAYLDVGDLETPRRQLGQLRIAAADRAIDVEARAEGVQARISLAAGNADEAVEEFTRALGFFGADDALLDRASIHHYFGRLL
jgi:hypothetical protein